MSLVLILRSFSERLCESEIETALGAPMGTSLLHLLIHKFHLLHQFAIGLEFSTRTPFAEFGNMTSSVFSQFHAQKSTLGIPVQLHYAHKGKHAKFISTIHY